MLAKDIVQGGIVYEGRKIIFPKSSGLGIEKVDI
jgi:hypothetical protein